MPDMSEDESASRIDGRTREARAAKLAALAAPAATTGDVAETYEGEDITYLPGDGDPHTVKWRDHTFMANVKKRVKDKDLIEAARGNWFFQVGDEVKVNPRATPTDAMQYRAHVVAAMRSVTSVEELVSRWSSERTMRQTCGVGEDDILYLGTIIEPALRKMRLAEGLTEQQVADIWIKYGVLDLPWRSG